MREIWQRDPSIESNQGYFASPQWSHVLEGLGCRVVPVRHLELGVQVAVPIFRRGPLRMGFLGFPVAGPAFDRMAPELFKHDAASLARTLDLHIVRGTRCSLETAEPGHCLPEIWTDDLADWPGKLGRRLSKDLAFARRACEGIRIASGGGEPGAWHALYAATIRAQGGKLRYTEEYFRRLAAAADVGGGLRAFQAGDQEGRVLGFAVLAVDQGAGFYLHGSVHESARRLGLSDLLLWELIHHAKDQGVRRFSMMASPAAQDGLIRFKRKWASHQGYSVTQDVARGWLGKCALALHGRLRPGPAALAGGR